MYSNYSQVSQITYTCFARQAGPLLNNRKFQGSSLQEIMTASSNRNRQRGNKRNERQQRKQGVPARVSHIVTWNEWMEVLENGETNSALRKIEEEEKKKKKERKKRKKEEAAANQTQSSPRNGKGTSTTPPAYLFEVGWQHRITEWWSSNHETESPASWPGLGLFLGLTRIAFNCASRRVRWCGIIISRCCGQDTTDRRCYAFGPGYKWAFGGHGHPMRWVLTTIDTDYWCNIHATTLANAALSLRARWILCNVCHNQINAVTTSWFCDRFGQHKSAHWYIQILKPPGFSKAYYAEESHDIESDG